MDFLRNRRNKRKPTKHRYTIKLTIILSVLIGLLFFSVIFSLLKSTSTKIVKGVKIEGIDLSRLTQEEAKEKINKWYEEVVLQDISLQYDGLEDNINMEELNVGNNIDNCIKEALEIGRSGNIVRDNYTILFTMLFGKEIDVDISYDREKLSSKIEEISNKLPGTVVESSYYIEGEELIIKTGTPGITVEKEELENLVIERMKESNKIIGIPVKNVDIAKIDIQKIHNEIYKEAKNAYVEEETKRVKAHVNGVDFAISTEEIEEILSEAKEEYVIPLKITTPAITLYDLGSQIFPDKISEFITRYDASNKNRSNNIEIATEKVNGTVVMPGETFSYNKTVGQRTIAKGYKEAAVYSGGKVVDGVGGGICQLSSTLYNAALYANLEITKRSNHRFLTSYVQAGRDATVSWGTIDLCFVNTRLYPIKIVCSAGNGLLKVQITGTKEEKEYEIELQTKILEEIDNKTTYIKDNRLEEGTEYVQQEGSNGAKSETYKIVKLDGVVISKTLLSSDTYSSLEKIIRKGTKKPDEPTDIEIPQDDDYTELEIEEMLRKERDTSGGVLGAITNSLE